MNNKATYKILVEECQDEKVHCYQCITGYSNVASNNTYIYCSNNGKKRYQRCIYNSAKHLRFCLFAKIVIIYFRKKTHHRKGFDRVLNTSLESSFFRIKAKPGMALYASHSW